MISRAMLNKIVVWVSLRNWAVRNWSIIPRETMNFHRRAVGTKKSLMLNGKLKKKQGKEVIAMWRIHCPKLKNQKISQLAKMNIIPHNKYRRLLQVGKWVASTLREICLRLIRLCQRKRLTTQKTSLWLQRTIPALCALLSRRIKRRRNGMWT